MKRSLLGLRSIRWLQLKSAARSIFSTPEDSSSTASDTEPTTENYHQQCLDFRSEFSDAQITELLHKFNSAHHEELSQIRHCSSVKSANIVRHRQTKGEYRSLLEILNVPGIATLGLKKICHAILNDELSSKALKTRTSGYKTEVNHGGLCHPKMTAAVAKDVNSVLSIDLQMDKISWAHIDKQTYLLDWREDIVFDKRPMKYDHVYFHEKISEAVEKLPVADIYLLEGKLHRCSSLKLVPFYITTHIVEAVLMTILNKHLPQTGLHKVYILKPFTVSKHFSLIIGGERVSGQHIIHNIIAGSGSPCTASIPEPQIDYYTGLTHVQQENLSRAFLLGITFNQLILQKLSNLGLDRRILV
ncbi:transcription elongation factor, mitochondrial-like [Tubulanus polymorphus]|uniref:transcription elongation factor, mitochondrial-like n=1 Tax=Tubulanus polymorphus TaxID=672921 RepID=UPI003DA31CC7